MYWLHQHKPAQAVIGSCWLIFEWKACFAFIPLNMYNEKRGFIQGKWVKYLFYAFYPVHIAILTVIRKMRVTICGRFRPDEGAVAGYGNRIRVKSPAKWGVQIAGMIFQTGSSIIKWLGRK